MIAATGWSYATLGARNWTAQLQRALLGYLALYALGWLVHQGYYGTLLSGRDATVAATVSDWALLGVLAGLWPGSRRRNAEAEMHAHDFFLGAWFLLFLAVSISGWGHGPVLRFGPQRLEPLLWLPLCALCALALHGRAPQVRSSDGWPRAAQSAESGRGAPCFSGTVRRHGQPKPLWFAATRIHERRRCNAHRRTPHGARFHDGSGGGCGRIAASPAGGPGNRLL